MYTIIKGIQRKACKMPDPQGVGRLKRLPHTHTQPEQQSTSKQQQNAPTNVGPSKLQLKSCTIPPEQPDHDCSLYGRLLSKQN